MNNDPSDGKPPPSVPRLVGAQSERLIAARGDRERFLRLFERSSVPMLLLDDERRYVDANVPARLAFRQSLEEIRQLRVDDLTPESFQPKLQDYWRRLIGNGVVAGPYDVGSPEGTHLHVTFCGVANALPGLHLIVFAPSGWADFESGGEDRPEEPLQALTPRELEVLQLAAEGQSGPLIAQQLVVSAATVRTHFEHIYAKLGVSERAGAVAKAMRLGLVE